jgi:ParB-like chromosome segregation protein Spo0J
LSADLQNVVYLDPKTLVHYERNSKKHPPEQIEGIARSIKNTGFDQPVVVTEDLVIIKGHGRTLAALSLGLETIPVLIRTGISENDARFLREVDNQIQSAEWDKENLATELLELKDLGKLEFTLFTEETIPALQPLVINVKQEDYDLSTKHTCPKCTYKW